MLKLELENTRLRLGGEYMSDLFVSYSRADTGKASILAQALARQGWSVWWDRDIPPGKAFDEVIEEALHAAKCVIVLWSKASIQSDWVKTEAADAARRRILIPVLIEDVTIPFEFRRIQAANLCGWDGDARHHDFQEVIMAISNITGQTSRQKPESSPATAAQHVPSGGGRPPRAEAVWTAQLLPVKRRRWRTLQLTLGHTSHILEYQDNI